MPAVAKLNTKNGKALVNWDKTVSSLLDEADEGDDDDEEEPSSSTVEDCKDKPHAVKWERAL